MNVTKLAAAVIATAVTFGAGAVNIAPASAADNIKIFGEQERLNGPNGFPYIGYTVFGLSPSNDPVPHNGKLYASKLFVDGFGGNYNPRIEGFGARAQNGLFYPAIMGASNTSKLYFDVVGTIPNSVVWNDGVRDILAWIPGEIPLDPEKMGPAAPPEAEPVASGPERSVIAPGAAETDPALVATPNVIAPAPYELTEAEVASPGFHG